MRVILAEGDTTTRDRIAKAIRVAGHEVSVAGSLAEAAGFLASGRHDILLIGASDEAMDYASRTAPYEIQILTFAAHDDQLVLFDRDGVARYGQRFPIERIVEHLSDALSGAGE